MKLHYSLELDPDATAKAMGKELKISPKHAIDLCRNLRGLEAEQAKEHLQEVIDGKRAVPTHRKAGHRRGAGGKDQYAQGRYPQKAAKTILSLIEEAEHNAEYKGLPSELYVRHIAAHRGRVTKGYRPRAHGRSTPWNVETANIEVILGPAVESMER